MPKPSPAPKHDPMSGVVDRLLAQLPGLQSQPTSSSGKTRGGAQWSTHTVTVGSSSMQPGNVLAVWVRVLLALSLGVMMGAWPYPNSCGQPLAGYLAAVLTLALTSGWAATCAWKHRAALAHVVALIILFYGILLGAAELLPRVGYATQQAHWQCEKLAARLPVLSNHSSVGLHQLAKG